MSNVVKDTDEPLSPDSQAYVDNYSPSKESPSLVASFGRRRLRVMNGQDPVLNPDKFTPPAELRYYKWPTEEEARIWAAKVIAAARFEPKCKQMLFTTSSSSVGCASSDSPFTLMKENPALGEAVKPMPMQQFT